jgi:hypothetical protein
MPSRLVTVAATGAAVTRHTNAGTATAATRNITVISASNATPIVVGATAHNLQVGFQVTISGVTGNTAANGTWLVRSVNANDFTIENLDHTDTVGNAAYVSGGTIVSTDCLVDSGASPTFSSLNGYRLEIVAGKGQGQVRLVGATHSTTILVPNRAWTITPDTTSVYRVYRGPNQLLWLKSAVFSVGAGAGAVTLRDGASGANLLTLSCPASDSRSWAAGEPGQGIPFSTSIYVQAISGTGPSCTLEYSVGA